MAFAKIKLLESTDVEVEELQLDCRKGERDLDIIIRVSMMMVILVMIRMVMIMIMKRGTLSIAIGSMGRTGGSSSGIPVDIIGRIPFIVLHVDHHHG